jgi:flagellar M-ring protein FliF
MRSFTWLSSGTALGRLHTWLERLLAVRPVVRWLLAALTIAVVAYLGFLGASALSTTSESVYLGSARSYSRDDLNKIGRALDRQRVRYHIDEERRISVAEDQRDLAEAAIAKLDIGPRAPGEIADQSFTSNVWEPLHDREIRLHREEEKILESMIGEIPGVVGCFVRLDQPKQSYGLRPAARPSAFVRLETEGDRPLPFQTVQSITTILRGYEPGLSAEAITVMDRKGYKYLDAGNPALNVLTHNRAREEELSQEILNQLDWIRGVRVSVQLADATAGEGRTLSSRSEPGGTEPVGPKPRPTAPTAEGTGPDTTQPIGALNRPLGAIDVPPKPETPPAVKAPPRVRPTERGWIWIKVPRSYYYQIGTWPGHREPSIDELQKLAAKEEERIKTGVAQVVRLNGPGAWTAMIDVIPDEIPLNPAPILTSASDTRRVALDWGIAGALGAMAAALVLLLSWILNARRPDSRQEVAPRGLRYHSGSSASRGPSERVREFVRRNPDSAVCVLERWTSQGGTAS